MVYLDIFIPYILLWKKEELYRRCGAHLQVYENLYRWKANSIRKLWLLLLLLLCENGDGFSSFELEKRDRKKKNIHKVTKRWECDTPLHFPLENMQDRCQNKVPTFVNKVQISSYDNFFICTVCTQHISLYLPNL